MLQEDIASFLREKVEPLPACPPYGERYRVAGVMKDGTQLPCIVFEGVKPTIDLAIRRFDQTRKRWGNQTEYRSLVSSFLTKGNTVNDYDLENISLSPHAIPISMLRHIGGETSMGWTEFYAVMSDGVEFRFGTSFLTEFFEMPVGYTATDISQITPAVRGVQPTSERIYREKPFFTCYVEWL